MNEIQSPAPPRRRRTFLLAAAAIVAVVLGTFLPFLVVVDVFLARGGKSLFAVAIGAAAVVVVIFLSVIVGRLFRASSLSRRAFVASCTAAVAGVSISYLAATLFSTTSASLARTAHGLAEGSTGEIPFLSSVLDKFAHEGGVGRRGHRADAGIDDGGTILVDGGVLDGGVNDGGRGAQSSVDAGTHPSVATDAGTLSTAAADAGRPEPGPEAANDPALGSIEVLTAPVALVHDGGAASLVRVRVFNDGRVLLPTHSLAKLGVRGVPSRVSVDDNGNILVVESGRVFSVPPTGEFAVHRSLAPGATLPDGATIASVDDAFPADNGVIVALVKSAAPTSTKDKRHRVIVVRPPDAFSIVVDEPPTTILSLKDQRHGLFIVEKRTWSSTKKRDVVTLLKGTTLSQREPVPILETGVKLGSLDATLVDVGTVRLRGDGAVIVDAVLSGKTPRAWPVVFEDGRALYVPAADLFPDRAPFSAHLPSWKSFSIADNGRVVVFTGDDRVLFGDAYRAAAVAALAVPARVDGATPPRPLTRPSSSLISKDGRFVLVEVDVNVDERRGVLLFDVEKQTLRVVLAEGASVDGVGIVQRLALTRDPPSSAKGR